VTRGHFQPERVRTAGLRTERSGRPGVPGDEAFGYHWQRLGDLKRRIQHRSQKYRFHLFDLITRRPGNLFHDFIGNA
jgi:hypothetical protein